MYEKVLFFFLKNNMKVRSLTAAGFFYRGEEKDDGTDTWTEDSSAYKETANSPDV